jgi:hypothetical protein
MAYAEIRQALDQMFPAMPEVKPMPIDQCSFVDTGEFDRDIAELEGLLKQRRARPIFSFSERAERIRGEAIMLSGEVCQYLRDNPLRPGQGEYDLMTSAGLLEDLARTLRNIAAQVDADRTYVSNDPKERAIKLGEYD